MKSSDLCEMHAEHRLSTPIGFESKSNITPLPCGRLCSAFIAKMVESAYAVASLDVGRLLPLNALLTFWTRCRRGDGVLRCKEFST